MVLSLGSRLGLDNSTPDVVVVPEVKTDEIVLFSLVGIEAGKNHPFNCPHLSLQDEAGDTGCSVWDLESCSGEYKLYHSCPKYQGRNGGGN